MIVRLCGCDEACKACSFCRAGADLYTVQVGIFSYIETRARLGGIQIVMPDYQSVGVALMQLFEQLSHSLLLRLSARVGRLAANVVPALVAYANRMAVVVHAVGTDHPFRPAWLYASVTTDDVVVADALKFPFLMPLVYLCCRTRLVWPYRATVNDNQCNSPHDCTSMVELMAVRIVITI